MDNCEHIQEVHSEILHNLDKRIDKLVTMQEITTTNIDKLTKDIKATMCNKNSCELLQSKILILEEKAQDITHYQELIEDIDKKMKSMWFFLFASRHPKLILLMALGTVAIALSDVEKFISKIWM